MATKKTLLQKAQDLNEQKDYQALIDLLPEAILQQEKSADLYAEKAQAYYRLDKIELCGEMADQALGLDGEHTKALHYKGSIYANANEYAKAIEYFGKAIVSSPKFEYSYNGLGNVYYELKEYDLAKECYGKAIAINSNNEYPYNGLGNVYADLKEYDRAKEWYKKAIAINPQYAHPYNGLGTVYVELKDYPQAIAYCEKASEINPQYDAPLYNRASAYDATGEHEKALTDYKRYIELAKDNLGYYTKRARERIIELKKALQSAGYEQITELVSQIKALLLFSDGCITHYTGLSTAKALVLSGSPFRLSEGAFLNDTSEGRELFKYLDFQATAHKSHDMAAITFGPKPFIGSFVADTKYDDLTLWRMYGKEQKDEGKGCAITIDPTQLIEAIQNKLMPGGGAANMPRMGDDFRFYRVAYKLPQGGFVLPGFEDDPQEKDLNETLQKLAAKVKEVSEHPTTTAEDKQNILIRLNEIAYLFKTAEYQHEQEIRLVLDGVGFDKELYLDATPPRVYIELVNIRPLIQKITIGPKVERGDEWAAAFYYSLGKGDLRPEICISHLPYK
jgi:tetratricopeptide (TPR) repeat protein